MNEPERYPADEVPTGRTALPKTAPTCSYLRVRVKLTPATAGHVV